MENIINFNNISLSYQGKSKRVDLFENLNLTFDKNEYAVILGKSGSGKTTILNLIAGFLSPDKGNITVAGNNIMEYDQKALCDYRNKSIGFVFQFFNLINQFTVVENVMAPLLIGGLQKKEAKSKALELIDGIGLKDRAKHYPYELSGGEQQRVCIARALANNPDIILADEPTGNLDEETGKHILDMFDDIHKQGKTIIMVTHDNDIADRATRVVRMNELTLH